MSGDNIINIHIVSTVLLFELKYINYLIDMAFIIYY